VSVFIWEIRCQARYCDNVLLSNMSMNETLWWAEDENWLIDDHRILSVQLVYCPQHHTRTRGEVWTAECRECDWDEEFDSEDEAHEAAADHEAVDCDCCWHDTEVLSPEAREERRKRARQAREEWESKQVERDATERYVAFLIDRDQQTRKRDMKRIDYAAKTSRREKNKHIAAVALVFIVAVLLIVLSACGALPQDCGDDQIASEDYGCIDKDDLDLNDSGSTDDEESEWDGGDD